MRQGCRRPYDRERVVRVRQYTWSSMPVRPGREAAILPIPTCGREVVVVLMVIVQRYYRPSLSSKAPVCLLDTWSSGFSARVSDNHVGEQELPMPPTLEGLASLKAKSTKGKN